MNALQPWRGQEILIVDDAVSIRESLRTLYMDMGLKVISAVDNGVKALEFLKTSRPDLISLDIIMPEMHGIECYRHIVELYPGLPCFFVTCLAADPRAAEAFAQDIPAYRFIPKPAQAVRVEACLRQLLAGSRHDEVSPPHAVAVEHAAATAS